MNTKTEFILTAEIFVAMIHGAALNLRSEAQKINDLNVFPVPDGDTGDNMLSTLMGGVDRLEGAPMHDLGATARRVADGMLLSARGNSGVILSQFFDGIALGFEGAVTADTKLLGKAFRLGVKRAYEAVMKPAEGTILTVAYDATEYACNTRNGSVGEFIGNFVDEARRSLDRTPELLPILKSAGVVDSGGAGLLSILVGMFSVFGDDFDMDAEVISERSGATMSAEIDYDAFTADDVLEFGYCTELLVRLQNSKTDPDNFDTDAIRKALSELGDSIAAVKSGTILKIHVHTKTPDRVLALCQRYGEFLKIKIENMSLQHNSLEADPITPDLTAPSAALHTDPIVFTATADGNILLDERKSFGIVVAARGEGIKQTFLECGADFIVEGGQSMNPSAEDFIAAFDAVNAETIFVFPNNGNVILAARQAMSMYPEADVRVIESKSIGEGYAALSMIDLSSEDADVIEEQLYENMRGVVTAEVARCIRDAEMQDVSIHVGDYIGYVGKQIFAAGPNRLKTAITLADNLGLDEHGFLLLFCGSDSGDEEAEEIKTYIEKKYPACEVYTVSGGQDIYSYIMIAE